MGQKDFKAAERHARNCYKVVPNDPRVLSVYGEILVRTGQVDKGLEALERAYELDPVAQGKTSSDHRHSAVLFGNFMARNKDACLKIISELETVVLRSWILTA